MGDESAGRISRGNRGQGTERARLLALGNAVEDVCLRHRVDEFDSRQPLTAFADGYDDSQSQRMFSVFSVVLRASVILLVLKHLYR